MSVLRRNILSSVSLTAISNLVSVAVFPYVSRIFGVDRIGMISYVDSIATGFIILSMMGIGVLGCREVSRFGGRREDYSRVFWSIFSLHALMTLIACGAMCVLMFFSAELQLDPDMLFVGICKILASLFLVEWFFQGLERFRFLVWRTFSVKLAYVGAVFIFVKDASDMLLYYWLTLGVVVAIGVINAFYLRKLLLLPSGLKIKKYVKPYFRLGAYVLLGWVYPTACVAWLGFQGDAHALGCFASASKILTLLVAFSWAVTQAFLPRISSALSEGNIATTRATMLKGIKGMCASAFSVVLLGELFAPEIVKIVAGAEFGDAVTPMRVMMPIVFFTSLHQALSMHVLTPLRQDRLILRNSLFTSVTVLLLSILLTPAFLAEGAAWVWCAGEFTLSVLSLISVKYVIRAMKHSMPEAISQPELSLKS